MTKRKVVLRHFRKPVADPAIDVRIIFRRFPSVRQTLTSMKDFGFDIIDGWTVLVGSHNWTSAGTTLNRDEDIASYYSDLFLFDWNRVGNVRINESIPALSPYAGTRGASSRVGSG